MKLMPYMVFAGVYFMAKIGIRTSYDDMISGISIAHGNNPQLVKAIIKVESNFNPKAHNKTSKEDSRGLGQINAPTATALGVKDLEKLYDPEYNIRIMNKLLTDLKKRHDSIPDIIAAYNAGSVKTTKRGLYVNSAYVLNVYSRFIAYSILEF